jgi:hypothetical protein
MDVQSQKPYAWCLTAICVTRYFLGSQQQQQWHRSLRRTLPQKEQYPATKARRHKECFAGDKMEVYILLHLPCVAGFMDDCAADALGGCKQVSQ